MGVCMKKNNPLVYIVEGETEKKLIQSIKNEFIFPGKIYVRNLVQVKSIETLVRLIQNNSYVVIVFDTDINEIKAVENLSKNIKLLKKLKNVKEIILIPQRLNLEDELIFSSSIIKIKEFTKSKSNTEFKKDFLTITDLNVLKRIREINFDIDKFWNRNADNLYDRFENESRLIKKT